MTAFGASDSLSPPMTRAPLRPARAGRARVHHGKAARHPVAHFASATIGPAVLARNGIRRHRRRSAAAPRRAPGARPRSSRCPAAPSRREVRAGLVDDRDLEAFAVGLAGTRHVDVHAVLATVAVRVELGLDPQEVAHPVGRPPKRVDDLRLAVDEHGGRLLRRGVGGLGFLRGDPRQCDTTEHDGEKEEPAIAHAKLRGGVRAPG